MRTRVEVEVRGLREKGFCILVEECQEEILELNYPYHYIVRAIWMASTIPNHPLVSFRSKQSRDVPIDTLRVSVLFDRTHRTWATQ